MAEKFGLGYEHINTHHELAPERKEDPGKAFDLKAFKAAFDKN
jgi:N-acetyl-anhydromuramyl-L-alanine amidase AmpD